MVTLRAARPLDAGAMGDILWDALRGSDDPDAPCSGAEAIGLCGLMIERNWVTVAASEAGVQGFLARDGEEICALYVAPAARRQGIGELLVKEAKRQLPRLHLQTAFSNRGAQQFYRQAGFVPLPPLSGSDRDPTGIPIVWQQETAS